jgi:alkylation response protein AidB-like acyl-CoA dehydrogenase
MDFSLPDDVKLLQVTVRDYVRDRLLPISMQIERDDAVPQDVLDEMKALGLFSISLPEEYGGGGFSELGYCVAMEDRNQGTRGITAFVVDRQTPGVTVGKVDEKMGLRGSKTSEVFFEDACVPVENIIGEEGHGFRVAMQTLDGGRVALGASCVGQAQAALDMATRYSQQRVQFGRPISTNQAIQWMLADSAVEIHAARMMVYHAAWKIDSGQRASHEAAMVKVYCTEMANRVIDRALQIHGGMGYMKEFDIERMYRDARILRIYEGTSEVQRMIIADDLLAPG